jgi:hypothetical protein
MEIKTTIYMYIPFSKRQYEKTPTMIDDDDDSYPSVELIWICLVRIGYDDITSDKFRL